MSELPDECDMRIRGPLSYSLFERRRPVVLQISGNPEGELSSAEEVVVRFKIIINMSSAVSVNRTQNYFSPMVMDLRVNECDLVFPPLVK